MSLDILKGEPNGSQATDASATPTSVSRGIGAVEPVKVNPGRGGYRPGAGRKSKTGDVAVVPYSPPAEQFKPEDVLPVIELPFKLASVALRSDAVDLEEDEKARLGRTGATAANHWLQVSPKAFTGVIFLTTLTQVLLAKVILFKAEERARLDKLAKDAPPATPS